MYQACIAIVDASRARLFTFERSSDAGEIHEQLAERADLVNPARRLRSSELFSDSRPGVGRTGDLQYGIDDHRGAHLDELDAAFARSVLAEIDAQLRASGGRRLILCASPPMLGTLRAAGAEPRADGVAVDTLPRNLGKLTPSELRERLAEYGLLPPVPPRLAASAAR